MKKVIAELFDTVQWLAALVALVIIIIAFVTYLTAQAAIQFVAPIVVHFVGGAICLAIVLWFVDYASGSIQSTRLKWAEGNRDITLARNERHISDNDTRLSDFAVQSAALRLTAEGGMLGAQVNQMYAGTTYLQALGEARFGSHTSANAKRLQDGTPVLGEPMKPLLPLMVHAERLLFVGGMKSGKTTNLLWLAYERQKVGRVIVIDSHTTPAKWPAGCQVIGAKRNYRTIEALLKWLVKEMDRRFADMADGLVGERGHQIITVISDEWTLLPDAIPNVKDYIKPLLTESRKAGLDFFLAAHDHTCEALGLQGVSGLKKGFDAIIFCERHLDTEAHETRVAFDFKEKDAVPYEPPGPFIIQGTATGVKNDGTPLLGEPVGDVWDIGQDEADRDAEPTPREKIILDLFDEGASLNQISKTINEGRTGGPYNEEIKSTLARYGKLPV